MDKKGGQLTIESSTARPKADLYIQIVRGQKIIVGALREYDLKHSEIAELMEPLLEYGRQDLRVSPKNAEPMYEEELKAYREKTGELVVQIDVF